ncbi:DUF6090 family protein [Flavitalea flava]
MAENEIIKHTEAAYKTIKDPHTSWKHKIKEILIEIVIIVFAVTISIWFHNWSDRSREKKEEKEFLTGLKKDLKDDIEDINGSLKFYQFAISGMDYFIRVGSEPALPKKGNETIFNSDSLNKYQGIFFSSADFQPRNSRYEGLKASGKFTIIENKELLNDIISLHESYFPRIMTLNKYYYEEISNKVTPFLNAHFQLALNGGIANADEVLRISEMRLLLRFNKSYITNNILQAYEDGIMNSKEVIEKINKELE